MDLTESREGDSNGWYGDKGKKLFENDSCIFVLSRWCLYSSFHVAANSNSSPLSLE